MENGDEIDINIPQRSITLKVTEDEIAKRKESWVPKPPKFTKGYLGLYSRLASSASRGGILNLDA